MPTLRDAADHYILGRASKALLSFMAQCRRIFSFVQERANRLNRYHLVTRAYEDGKPVVDIIAKYGCSKGTVLRYARLAGLDKRPKPKFSDATRGAVIRAYTQTTKKVEDIAAENGVSPAYVSKLARELNISRYAPRPKKKRSA